MLNSLPSGTKKVDIEYIDNEEETKIVIYPTDGSVRKPTTADGNIGPSISSDEDLMNYI